MTLDEEINIARCLRSVAWSDDVVVLDSGSKDATRQIVAGFPNVRVFERAFTNFADQRNYGIREIRYANSWLLMLDADEEIEPELADEIKRACAMDGGPQAYMVRRNVVLEGRVLRWNLTSTFWIERLFRPSSARYVGLVHEKLLFDGPAGRLRGRIMHHQFDKGVDDWLRRRALYAELERAVAASPPAVNDRPNGSIALRLRLKRIFAWLPMRWAIYFVFNLVLAMSFLDGRRGIRYIWLEAYSHYLAGRRRRRQHDRAP